MWRYIKQGFGFSFGGRIGWELGGVVWRLARRLALAIGIAIYGAVQSCQPTTPLPEKPKKPVALMQGKPTQHRPLATTGAVQK